jgi:hypothetical protein
MRGTQLTRQTCTMATRFDPVAQVVPADVAEAAKRYADAAERRRLLSRALHAAVPVNLDNELISDHAITDRFVRVAITDLDDLDDADDSAAASASAEQARPQLGKAVDELRAQAAACRAKAIALNAKLVLLEAERATVAGGTQDLHAVREQLIESSARLDHAVEEIGAVTSVEQQLSTLR